LNEPGAKTMLVGFRVFHVFLVIGDLGFSLFIFALFQLINWKLRYLYQALKFLHWDSMPQSLEKVLHKKKKMGSLCFPCGTGRSGV